MAFGSVTRLLSIMAYLPDYGCGIMPANDRLAGNEYLRTVKQSSLALVLPNVGSHILQEKLTLTQANVIQHANCLFSTLSSALDKAEPR